MRCCPVHHTQDVPAGHAHGHSRRSGRSLEKEAEPNRGREMQEWEWPQSHWSGRGLGTSGRGLPWPMAGRRHCWAWFLTITGGNHTRCGRGPKIPRAEPPKGQTGDMGVAPSRAREGTDDKGGACEETWAGLVMNVGELPPVGGANGGGRGIETHERGREADGRGLE